MGSYEDEYRKYYSDVKAKLNIKSAKKDIKLKNESIVNIESNMDIYPKINNECREEKNVSKGSGNNYLISSYETKGAYKNIGTYTGIDNYNNIKSDNYGARSYYGYNGRNSFDGKSEEKTLLNKWGNRVIFKLAITVGLFISVIALKSLPYEEAKAVYTACKEVVSKDFDYKEFIEEVKTINITEEMDKIKVNLKIDEDEVQVENLNSN